METARIIFSGNEELTTGMETALGEKVLRIEDLDESAQGELISFLWGK